MHQALLSVDPTVSIAQEELSRLRRHNGPAFPWSVPDQDNRAFTGAAFWQYMNRHFINVFSSLVPEKTAQEAAVLVRPLLLDPGLYAVFPDAEEALQACLDRGAKNYILSNNYPELPFVLQALGLLKYFRGVVVSGAVGLDKPRPEIFRFARQLAGSPERCLMVGDNPSADIEGALRAGMTAVQVHNTAPSRADYRFETLLPVVDLVK